MSLNNTSEQQPAESTSPPSTLALPMEEGPGVREPLALTLGEAWDRQANEPPKAFGAFRAYLALGPDRSLTKAAAATGRTKDQLAKWSARWNWITRAAAFTGHLAQVEREASESLVRQRSVDWVVRQEQQREEEWKVRCELLHLAREAMERWKSQAGRCGSLEGIARLLDLASKLGRLASGMPTGKTEVSAEIEAKVDVEWEIALKKVYGQPLPGEAIEAEVVGSARSDMSDMSDMGDRRDGREGGSHD